MIISVLFFLSGLAGLIYQIIWVRLAFTYFGIITPVLSTIISIFMLGLGLGAWMAGRLVHRRPRMSAENWLRVYGVIELSIGLWSLAVPRALRLSENLFLGLNQMSSVSYLALSGFALAVILLPACTLMGMTYPIMMAFLRKSEQRKADTFSSLYRANVLGAFGGSILPAFCLIELFGLHGTNRFAVMANLVNATICFVIIGLSLPSKRAKHLLVEDDGPRQGLLDRTLLWPVFLTGFVSMAFEVIWTRSFTPILGTTIYAFSVILAIYLAASWAGTSLYRYQARNENAWPLSTAYAALAFTAFLPLFLIDCRRPCGITEVIFAIFPFCFSLGYATPQIVDRYCQGDAMAAGRAYAINVAGCVIGPLIACYLVLPYTGSKWGILILTMPLFGLIIGRRQGKESSSQSHAMALAGLVLFVAAITAGVSPEEQSPDSHAQIRRDYTATIISDGKGFYRRLLVNGVGITRLIDLTKVMAHLPIWFHEKRPQKALVICFGMGTTFRSLLSYGMETRAVELVPSVPQAFGYYFDDADRVLSNPLGRVIIDDGRRFLERTTETFDIVTLDPPPPVEAAGSGLLYSKEFYELVKRRLNPDGIVQQWWPGGELKILMAVAQSLHESFPYLRVYKGLGGTGFHFLASSHEIKKPTIEECLARMTPSAQKDLLEWSEGRSLRSEISEILKNELPIEPLVNPDHAAAITDDQPYNEYYFLRRWVDKSDQRYRAVL